MKKKISYHFGVKVAAWFLLTAFAFVFFLGIAGVAVLLRTGAYWDGGRTFRESAAEQMFSFDKVRIRYIMREYLADSNIDDAEYREMYDRAKSNVFFTISDSEGNIIADYGSGDAYQIEYKYEEFFLSDEKEKKETKFFETSEEVYKYIEDLEKEHYITDWGYSGTTGALEITYYPQSDITYTVNAFIRKDFTSQDRYYYTLRGVDFIVAMRYWIILISVAGAVLCFLTVIFLCMSAGRTQNGEVKLSFMNRIPLDIFWAVCAFLGAVLLLALSELSLGDEYEWFTVAMFVIVCTSCATLFTAALVTFSARVKAKAWYKNTVIYRVLVLLKKLFAAIFRGLRFLIKNIPLFWQTLAVLVALKAAELFCLIASPYMYVLFWMLEFIVLIAAIIYIMLALNKLKKAAKEMAQGNLDYRAELSHMPQALREHGENLNNIGEGLKAALSEKIKSEHMKAELITNVSHDIKTPLTSIVNYVGLLKKEGAESEHEAEYLEVLERQSGKLKKLT